MTRGRGLPILLLIVAVALGALLQGLTATPGLGRMPAAAFAAMAAASVLILVAQLAVAAWSVHALMVRGAARPWAPLIAWAAVIVVVGATATILFPPAGVLVALAALFVLPAAAAGERRALRGFRVFARVPGRAALVVLGGIVCIGVSIVVAIATGLFLTGTIGGATAWLWFGIGGAALLAWSTRLAMIAREHEGTHTGLPASRDQNRVGIRSPH